MSSSQLIRALALSCHPIPSVAVTAISAGLVALAGLPIGRGALVTVAVFTGQLSIGWSNDYLDAERDRAVLRSDKPVATGAMKPRVAGTATVAGGMGADRRRVARRGRPSGQRTSGPWR